MKERFAGRHWPGEEDRRQHLGGSLSVFRCKLFNGEQTLPRMKLPAQLFPARLARIKPKFSGFSKAVSNFSQQMYKLHKHARFLSVFVMCESDC